jgi:hypothetical protein
VSSFIRISPSLLFSSCLLTRLSHARTHRHTGVRARVRAHAHAYNRGLAGTALRLPSSAATRSVPDAASGRCTGRTRHATAANGSEWAHSFASECACLHEDSKRREHRRCDDRPDQQERARDDPLERVDRDLRQRPLTFERTTLCLRTTTAGRPTLRNCCRALERPSGPVGPCGSGRSERLRPSAHGRFDRFDGPMGRAVWRPRAKLNPTVYTAEGAAHDVAEATRRAQRDGVVVRSEVPEDCRIPCVFSIPYGDGLPTA